MSKTRMIYVAVLLVAITILAWDRMFSENSVTSPQSSSAAATTDVETAHNITEAAISRANRIYADIPDALGRSDARPTGDSRTHAAIDTRLTGQRTATVQRLPRDLFLPSHTQRDTVDKEAEETFDLLTVAAGLRLSSTAVKQQNSCAIINGQILFVGQKIGPYSLVNVSREHVTIQADRTRIRLSLDKPPTLLE